MFVQDTKIYALKCIITYRLRLQSTMAIVLVFEDSQPVAFPHSTAAAAGVVTTYGSVFAKDIVYNHGLQVVSKADNTAASASNYTYYRASDGTLSEFARQTFSVDAGSTTGAYSVQCLRKNGAVTTLDRAFDIDHEQMVVSSTSSTDASLSSTCAINYNGLSFGTDSASIYFGSTGESDLILLHIYFLGLYL